jgi:hypothetical protein
MRAAWFEKFGPAADVLADKATSGTYLKESDTVDSALNRKGLIMKTPPGIAE